MRNLQLTVLFLLLIVGAASAFPTNSVLDNANRANEGPPPSANWTDIYGASDVRVVSNALTPGLSSEYTSGYRWNAASFGPDVEVYYTITNKGSNGSSAGRLFARIDSSGNNGYSIQWDSFVSQIKINKIDGAGSETQLGATISQSISSGDAIGMFVQGTTIELWYKLSGGSWTSLATRTDSTNSAAGYIGFDIYNPGVGTNPIIDDFGGGTIAGGGGVSGTGKGIFNNVRLNTWR